MTSETHRKRVLEILANSWRTFPELRLGQLIVNVSGHRSENDVFYVEDAEMLSDIADFTEKHIIYADKESK